MAEDPKPSEPVYRVLWEHSEEFQEYVTAVKYAQDNAILEADKESKTKLGKLYHDKKPEWKMGFHLAFPAVWLLVRIAAMCTAKTLLELSFEQNVPGIILMILGSIFGIAATYFQWDDGRWPTAQAKIRYCVCSGLSVGLDIASAIYTLANVGPELLERFSAVSGLLTAITSLLLVGNSFKLFAEGQASFAGETPTWSLYKRLALQRIPDSDIAWQSLPAEVRASGLERRNAVAYAAVRQRLRPARPGTR